MATVNDTSALNALNEKDYINKLYGATTDTTKKLLQENYTENTGLLNAEQQNVQKQTDENVKRTYVEAAQSQGVYSNGPKMSVGANAQVALSQGNTQQANVTSLKGKQSEADAEIERQRQLLASQYSTAIKQAQADNDMQKAQALYEAAKNEEAQFLALRQNASNLMLQKEDTSIRDALLRGETPSADYSGSTWEQVLQNEAALNEIYDKQLESERLGLQMESEEALSDLEVQQRQRQAQTDQQLTQTYVDALRKAKNYAEVQNAYGMGSGAFGQARLAQNAEMQRALTALRGVQMDAEADSGMQRFDIGKAYRDQLAKTTAEVGRQRAEALIEAAEGEEQSLYNLQLALGQQLANENNFSVLGKLYGLTQDQIDKLQGTGAYAPKPVYQKESGNFGDGVRKPKTEDKLTRKEQAAIIHQSVAAGEITQNQAQALLKQIK